MSNVKYFKKKAIQAMETWQEGYDMTGVSVSVADAENGSPKTGDFIASNPSNPSDKWLVAAKFIEENYEEVARPETLEGPLEGRMLTVGELRVRTKFNPSADGLVDAIKQKSAELINLVASLKDKRLEEAEAINAPLPSQDKRTVELYHAAHSCEKAMDKIEEAAMHAVKAATA